MCDAVVQILLRRLSLVSHVCGRQSEPVSSLPVRYRPVDRYCSLADADKRAAGARTINNAGAHADARIISAELQTSGTEGNNLMPQ